MKQLYFFISFLFVTQISTSQSLIDTTKLWNEVECFSGPFVACQTKSYKFQGDTVINSYQYKKLFFTLDTLLMNWSLTGAIREVGQKVYYNNFNNADYLLYDFAANVGDTIEPISFCLSNYLIADSVDTVIVNGSPRRRLIFNFMPCLYTEEWIEGMGSTHGIINRLIVYGDLPADYGTELLCFWQNDTINWINQSYNDCYVTFGIGIDEQNKKPSVRVFPNPILDFAIVEHSELNKKWTWMLFNTFGQCVQKVINISDVRLKINKENLSAGIYFYQVRTADSLIGSGKLIIE